MLEIPTVSSTKIERVSLLGNLYPAQEEGLPFCQLLHPETELQDLSQNEDCLLCLL